MTAATTGLIAHWARYYGDHKMVSANVTFVHLAGVLLGGGLAIASDRTSLQLVPGETGLAATLARLQAVHRWVFAGLALTLASGLLMLFADLSTYLPSVLYWAKMALVAALLLNGWWRVRLERTLVSGPEGWPAFRMTSGLSVFLWFATLLLGALLPTLS